MPLGRIVGGIDEAGNGPLAGPIITACVALPYPEDLAFWPLPAVKDSKKIRDSAFPKIVIELVDYLEAVGGAFAIVSASAAEINRRGHQAAYSRAMTEAAARVDEQLHIDKLYVDGSHLIETTIPQEAIVKGDSRVFAIAAASVLAKSWRDAEMACAALDFPGYGFEEHHGYYTKTHLEALMTLGSSPIHRTQATRTALNTFSCSTNQPTPQTNPLRRLQ
jgi:ribonuclease HII